MTEARVKVWVQPFKDRPLPMLQWFDPDTGKRKSKTAKTDDPEKVEQARSDLEYELNHGKYQEASKLTWEAFRQKFEDEYLPGLRERTQEKYRTVLDVFEQIASPTKLRSVNEQTLSRFVKGMRERKQPRKKKVGLAAMTQRNYLVALKKVLGWAVDQKFLPTLPTFPKIKVPKKKPRPVAPADFDKLLKQAPNDEWRAFLLCAWWCGLRLSEARHLQRVRADSLPWVDFEADRIWLPATFAKSDEDQWMPLHPVLREALEQLPANGPSFFNFRSRKGGGPLSRNGITNRVILMAKKAGVSLSMHRLRKGFGSRVAMQLGKGNAPILHRMMRHSSMQVTMEYYANVDDALHDAIQTLV
jgi:integrase